MLSAEELQANKEMTHWFIQSDPTVVSLVPRERVKQPSGGFKWAEMPPRAPQSVKMIPQGGSLGGIVTAEDGVNRRYDFVMLGEWNAIIKLNDIFRDPIQADVFWEVTGMEPFNGYEVKARVSAYGKELPDG